MANYRLISIWRLSAPLQPVFDAVFDSLHWPQWWPGADSVEQLVPGDQDGIGNSRRYAWKGRLPYRLSFDARTTRIETLRVLEAAVSGDVEGVGRWTFSHESGVTTVRHEWCVCTTRCWMNMLAPVSRTAFQNNHHALMKNGAHGLARLLGASLVEASGAALPVQAPGADRRTGAALAATKHAGAPPDWLAAAFAGFFAGIIATLVQLALWWLAARPAVDMLLRDARLAAAIVMGRNVLPPPITFDWGVMLAASAVHFALSVAYGLLVAPLVARLALRPAILAGAAFGMLLYAVNMYGFTALFPWFAASRDWITAAAHAAFGMTAAVAYKFSEKRILRSSAHVR